MPAEGQKGKSITLSEKIEENTKDIEHEKNETETKIRLLAGFVNTSDELTAQEANGGTALQAVSDLQNSAQQSMQKINEGVSQAYKTLSSDFRKTQRRILFLAASIGILFFASMYAIDNFVLHFSSSEIVLLSVIFILLLVMPYGYVIYFIGGIGTEKVRISEEGIHIAEEGMSRFSSRGTEMVKVVKDVAAAVLMKWVPYLETAVELKEKSHNVKSFVLTLRNALLDYGFTGPEIDAYLLKEFSPIFDISVE